MSFASIYFVVPQAKSKLLYKTGLRADIVRFLVLMIYFVALCFAHKVNRSVNL